MAPQAIGGTVALVAVTALYGLLLAALRRSEIAGSASLNWGFGYARDGVNLGCFIAYFAAFSLVGFDGPAAFVLAVAILLAVYLGDWTFGRRFPSRRARIAMLALIACLAIALALAAPSLGVAVDALIALASPR